MADHAFHISVPVGDLIPSGMKADAAAFPTLSYAVKAVAEAAHQQWVAYAHGAPLPDGRTIKTRTNDYVLSIQVRQVGDFAAEVYSELPEAEGIEDGMPARDLKRMLGTSAKTRVNKKGGKYLIIPFRHAAPGSIGSTMPPAVHGWWQAKERSHVTSIGTRASQVMPGVQVPAYTYHWGARLKAGDLSALGVTGQGAKRMQGMVNFRRPGHGGGASHSRYMTFRTMSEKSSGWIVPAKPGYHPAKVTADSLRPIAEKAFAKAVEEDLKRALGGK